MDRAGQRAARTLSGSVMDEIGRRIVSGAYPSGAALPPEFALCAEFALSRTPLREAMKRLHAKGLVQMSPKTGTRVRPQADWSQLDPDVLRWRLECGASDEVIDQLYELRMVFEPEASRLAAIHGDAQDHRRIAEAFDRMAELIGDADRVVEADIAFHMAIIAATHNVFLVSVSNAIGAALKVQFELGAQRRSFPRAELDLHGRIRDMILAGRGEEASEATKQLIRASRLSVGLGERVRPARAATESKRDRPKQRLQGGKPAT